MKKYFLFFTVFIAFFGHSQKGSDYRYVVVPAKFEFQKQANQYNLNALTKMVFEKQGYEVYYDTDVLPQPLAENRCKALYAQLLTNNNLFLTRLKLEVKDCKNQVVLVSEEGSSREKEYEKAYIQAFRTVGKSVAVLQSKPSQQERSEITTATIQANTVSQTLFAQPIANGFQLVDVTPKIVMRLLKTSADNFYIGYKDAVQGVVFQKNNQWFFEYYQNDTLVFEKLAIKF